MIYLTFYLDRIWTFVTNRRAFKAISLLKLFMSNTQWKNKFSFKYKTYF